MQKEEMIRAIFDKARIKLNGADPWCPQITNPNGFFSKIYYLGSLGLGESYMDDDWSCKALDKFFHRFIKMGAARRSFYDLKTQLRWGIRSIPNLLQNWILNPQKHRAFRVAHEHYDKKLYLFETMLGENMTYTCGRWNGVNSLLKAQNAKNSNLYQKLSVQSGNSIAEIGLGYGAFAKLVLEMNEICSYTGLTVSRGQLEFAKKLIGEDAQFTYKLTDYRNLSGIFDRIISIGMFEAVGPRNLREFFKVMSANIQKNGIFVLHTIIGIEKMLTTDPWIWKYIFPYGYVPTIAQTIQAAAPYFIPVDVETLNGTNYDKTLMVWHKNFIQGWNEIKKQCKYDERFKRMWEYYLLACAGMFRAQTNHVAQFVFRPHGATGHYSRIIS